MKRGRQSILLLVFNFFLLPHRFSLNKRLDPKVNIEIFLTFLLRKVKYHQSVVFFTNIRLLYNLQGEYTKSFIHTRS